MAWNEPGGGKDPWGGNRNDQGPPDIDEALKKLEGGALDYDVAIATPDMMGKVGRLIIHQP